MPACLAPRERIVIELMTSDRGLEASREGSKGRIYGTLLAPECPFDVAVFCVFLDAPPPDLPCRYFTSEI